MTSIFNLSDKTVFITGGAGFLGKAHAEAILEHGGSVVIADYDVGKALEVAEELGLRYGRDRVRSIFIDVTDKDSIELAASLCPSVNVLINNAAKNPVVSSDGKVNGAFETMTLEEFKSGIETSLDGTFLCSQVFCKKFVYEGGGVIVNISSDLGVIAPDQRIYLDGKKPITYSASKFGVVGMTKYLATYFAEKNIRVNCLSPGGVYNNQPDEFVERLTNLIPMGRMANRDEYKGAIVFLCSDASSYMTGENIVMNGGRAAW